MKRERIYITNPDEIDSIDCEMESQETAINWCRRDTNCTVCVSDNTSLTRFVKAMRNDPESYKCYYYESNRNNKSGKLGNYFFEFPHRLLSYRSQSTREYTDEQREEMRNRLLSVRGKDITDDDEL